MRRLVVGLTVLALFLAACTPAPADPVEVVVSPTPPPATEVPTEVPTEAPEDHHPAEQAALEALAAALGLDLDEISVIAFDGVVWPDGCLGVEQAGVVCTDALVEGYRVVLEADGRQYEYRTNGDGTVVLPTEGGPAGVEADHIEAARRALADALGLSLDEITVVRSALAQWPDACLGISDPLVLCAPVVTSGYRVVLEANGQEYEYRTNADASVVKPAALVLAWKRVGGIAGFCDVLQISRGGAVLSGACRAELAEGALTAEEQAQLDEWLAHFGAVGIKLADDAVADGMTITLSLVGYGEAQPDEAEQEALAAWAQAVYTRLSQAES